MQRYSGLWLWVLVTLGALACSSDADSPDYLRIAASITEWVHIVRAVVSSHIPSHVVALLGGMGIAAFGASDEVLAAIRGGKKLTLPAPTGWSEDGMVKAQLDGKSLELRWLGRAGERSALMSGLSAPRKANKPSPR